MYPGKYFTGDGCRRDEDGYYWITGRVDDVLNVAGHRIGTAEVESALVAHEKVRRGRGGRLPARHQGPGHLRLRHLKPGKRATELRKELVAKQQVRKEIGPSPRRT
jgi:acetyl-CoA synthetase